MSDPPPKKKSKVNTNPESLSDDQQNQELPSDATDDFVFKVPTSPAPKRKSVSKKGDQNPFGEQSGSSAGNHSESNVGDEQGHDMAVDAESGSIPEPSTSNGNNDQRPRNTTADLLDKSSDSDSSEDDTPFVMKLPKWKKKKGFSKTALKKALTDIDDILKKKLPPPGSLLKVEHHVALDELSSLMDQIPKQLDHMIDKLLIDFVAATNLSDDDVDRRFIYRPNPYDYKPPRKKRATTKAFPTRSQVDQSSTPFDELFPPQVVEPTLEFPRTTEEEFQEGLRILDAINSGAAPPNLPAETDNSDFGLSRLCIENALFPEAYDGSAQTNNLTTQQSDLRAEIVDELVMPNLGLNDVEMPVAADLNLDISLIPPITPDLTLASTSAAQQTTENAETLLQTEQRKKPKEYKNNVFRRSTMLSANRLDSFEVEALKDRDILYRSPPEVFQTFDFIPVDSIDFRFITVEVYGNLHGPLLTNDAVNSNPILRSQILGSEVLMNNVEDMNAILPLNDANVALNDAILPLNNDVLPPNNDILPPNNDILPPNNDILPPNNDIIPPNNDILPPNNDILPPNNDILPPNNDIVPPNNDILPPNNDILPPNNDILPPNNDILPPSNDISQPDPPVFNVPLQSDNVRKSTAVVPAVKTSKKQTWEDVLRQERSKNTQSSHASRSATIDFDSMSIDELIEQMRISRNEMNSIQRVSSPESLPTIHSCEYVCNTEDEKLLEEIDGALCTRDAITFEELRPVEFTDRLNAAFAFRTLLNLFAGQKVSIQQTGSSPQDIVISKKKD